MYLVLVPLVLHVQPTRRLPVGTSTGAELTATKHCAGTCTLPALARTARTCKSAAARPLILNTRTVQARVNSTLGSRETSC